MTNLQLEFDEGILLQTTEIDRYCYEEQCIDEMILTNKNIICIYEKSNGFFAKSDTVTEKIPLSTIKVVNGKAQAIIYDNEDYGVGIQILFVDGHREHFIFNNSPKKTMPMWLNAINKTLMPPKAETSLIHSENASATPSTQKDKDDEQPKNTGTSVFEKFDFNGLLEKAQSKLEEFTEKIDSKIQGLQQESYVEENVPENTIIPVPVPKVIQEAERRPVFCSNCGTKLNDGAKFCHNCGSATSYASPNETPLQVGTNIQQPTENTTGRKEEFVGKILKCPHCGGVITETTALCPTCGMQITNRAAVSSVQTFKEQLMEIESSRKQGYGKIFSLKVDPIDMKKLTLIRNFPIPNSIDDIVEFMLLAVANIEVSLSKQTAIKKLDNYSKSIETGATIATTISDAWVSKMEQVYKKAEILFPDNPAFTSIQKIYLDKMKELKIIK